jgi:hypothetical protein
VRLVALLVLVLVLLGCGKARWLRNEYTPRRTAAPLGEGGGPIHTVGDQQIPNSTLLSWQGIGPICVRMSWENALLFIFTSLFAGGCCREIKASKPETEFANCEFD